MDDWLREVTLDMLPDAHRRFAEVIGVEATLKLCGTWGGESLYIPIIDTVRAVVREKRIRQEFSQGASVARLAKRYGLTERAVQITVKEIRPEQINLWGAELGQKVASSDYQDDIE